MMKFNPITADQYETSERYYKLPKILFESDYYKDMRLDVKVSYAILKDRLSLSIKNEWVDADGVYYLIYSNAKLMSILNCSKSTLLRIKKQLAEYGLMKEVQQSNSKNGSLANRIYLGNLHSENQKNRQETATDTPVSNLDPGGVRFKPPGYQKETGPVSETATNEPEYNEPEYNNYSSRKAEKISEEISQPTETDNLLIKKQFEKYIPPKYYSLLQVIADKYNSKFCQLDLFTGEFRNFSLTHRQKMMIGQYLTEKYVTSEEVLNMIDRIPADITSPLAYLLKSLENLKEERRLEAKIVAHSQAELRYEQSSEGGNQ